MPPTHWEEALDASAVSRPGTTQYEPGPRWEAWEDELRETHEYDDWESKLQASAKRDPSMRPRKVTTVDVMVREALVSGLDQDEAIARAAAAPPPPSPFHPPYKGLGMVPRDRAPKREEDWWDHDDLHPDAHRMHGGANAETATYADGSPRKPHGGQQNGRGPRHRVVAVAAGEDSELETARAARRRGRMVRPARVGPRRRPGHDGRQELVTAGEPRGSAAEQGG